MAKHLDMNFIIGLAGLTRSVACLIILLLVCEISAGSVSWEGRRVVGIFRSENCPPAIAASLAVEIHNSTKSTTRFKYKPLIKGNEESLMDEELLRNDTGVVVTGHAAHCEQASRMLVNNNELDWFLICYMPPTPLLLELQESTENLYLSQPNPGALGQCLVNLVKFFIPQEATQSPFRSVTLLFNTSHRYSQVEEHLSHNLNGRTDITVNISLLEDFDMERYSSQLHTDKSSVHVLIVVLSPPETYRFLRELYKKRRFDDRLKIVLFDSFENYWAFEDYDEDSCDHEELLAAVEGHLFIQLPEWNINIDQSRELLGWKGEMLSELAEIKEDEQSDFSDAPLAYDSVLAMIRGITLAADDEQKGANAAYFSRLVMEQLGKTREGLSGEFSFNDERIRKWANSTVVIKQYINGRYEELGRYLNANSMFLWTKLPMSNKDSTWKSIQLDCQKPKTQTKTRSTATTTGAGGWITVLTMIALYYF